MGRLHRSLLLIYLIDFYEVYGQKWLRSMPTQLIMPTALEPLERPEFARDFSVMPDNAHATHKAQPATDRTEVRDHLAALIAAALNLDVAPRAIDPEAPLYGEGLGLDSIDILEIALVVAKEYGIQIKADSAENHLIFRSLNALTDFVISQRT